MGTSLNTAFTSLPPKFYCAAVVEQKMKSKSDLSLLSSLRCKREFSRTDVLLHLVS